MIFNRSVGIRNVALLVPPMVHIYDVSILYILTDAVIDGFLIAKMARKLRNLKQRLNCRGSLLN